MRAKKMKATVPKITVSSAAHQKIQHWVKLAPGEISGLGTVQEVDGGYYIDEVYLLEQECTGSDTELDDMAIAQLQMELMQREPGLQDKLLFWWHSHARMNCFWSSTDEECIKQCLGDRYLISIVYNKSGDYKARIDFGNNHFTVTMDDLIMSVEPTDTDLLMEEVYDEVVDEFDDDERINLWDFAKKFFESLVKSGLVNTENHYADLGLKDFCKGEYEEKVTNKYSSGYMGGYGGYGGSSHYRSRGGKKKGKNSSRGSSSKIIRPGNWPRRDDIPFEEGFEDSEETVQDVYDMMRQTFGEEEHFID